MLKNIFHCKIIISNQSSVPDGHTSISLTMELAQGAGAAVLAAVIACYFIYSKVIQQIKNVIM